MKKKSWKKKSWRRRKRILIAYSLRTLVLLFFVGILVLLVKGGMLAVNFIRGINTETVRYTALVGGDNESLIDVISNDGSEMSIILDAGHGGTDIGTFSGDIYEKDINLAVTLLLKEQLEQRGFRVYLTREEDTYVSLEERARIANDAGAGLFLSIHCNYYEDDSSIAGLESYYLEGSESGKTYAEAIADAAKEDASISARGAKTAKFQVLRGTSMPAVLVEIGYMSNASELKKLTDEDYQKKMAVILADAIEAQRKPQQQL